MPPCSVGILVDRGLGTTTISRTSISLYTAVIFIGGKYDQEALAYAGRVACHLGVKLTYKIFMTACSWRTCSLDGKYLINPGQSFSTLRSLEEKYGLIIVGR
ncbi:unnamed protein product [Fraxinus pennsylvanica]|uniref:Uncharacterized protein n=1 Tax=Fraxinus pennsylvanica TaxID=56036 RepID=A0AAD1ZK12_9LAMI|nr:unnamed protein product [Fraxinus pennsylvanica]